MLFSRQNKHQCRRQCGHKNDTALCSGGAVSLFPFRVPKICIVPIISVAVQLFDWWTLTCGAFCVRLDRKKSVWKSHLCSLYTCFFALEKIRIWKIGTWGQLIIPAIQNLHKHSSGPHYFLPINRNGIDSMVLLFCNLDYFSYSKS